MPEKKKTNLKTIFNTKTIVTLGSLIAIEIVLSRFLSFSIWNMKIGFSFVPIVIAAIMFGPIQAGIVGAFGDLLGATLFPIGAYFPGFTFTAFLTGVVFGLFLNKKQTIGRVLPAVGINQLILSLLLNTYWISVLYGSPFSGLIPVRVIQTLILIPVQIVVIMALSKALKKTYFKKAIA